MPLDKDVKDCPFCGEKVEEKAEKCSFCGRIFRLDFSPQKMSAESKKIGYIAAGIIIFIAVIFLILFISAGNKKENTGLSSDNTESSPMVETLPEETDQIEKGSEAESVITSSETNIEPSKNIEDKTDPPLGKSSPTENKKTEEQKKPSVKPLPKPKQDKSDFYTLG